MKNNIDLSIRRRKYYRSEKEPILCPECNSELLEGRCTVLLAVKSDTDEGEFMTNMSGSHFCNNCPVVVFDKKQIEEAAILGIRGDENLKYTIVGIVDLKSIPKEKKHLELGIDENPLPLVHFLPDLNISTKIKRKKIGRNAPCPCGSGKKYKKCCGK